MSWNYRIVERTIDVAGHEFKQRAIHEVFYDHEGAIKYWSMHPVDVSWDPEDGDELVEILERMKEASTSPVLREVKIDGVEKLIEL